jgi:tetratricopeptide (TPR) repeat protein
MTNRRKPNPAVEDLLAMSEELWEQFQQSREAPVLDRAITILERAVDMNPEDRVQQVALLANLGVALGTRYASRGNLTDLNGAIELFRTVGATALGSDAARLTMLTNLAMALTARFERTGEMADLDESVEAGRIAVTATPSHGPARATALTNLAMALTVRFGRTGEMADLDESVEAGRSAVTATPSHGPARATALTNLGSVLRELGQPSQSLGQHEQALALFRELGDRHSEARALSNLANSFRDLGRFSEARQASEQALTLFRELGDRHSEARALSNLGSVHRDLGQFQKARQASEQALTLFRELGDRHSEARALSNLGSVHRDLGQFQKARQASEQALTLFRELGDRRSEGAVLMDLAETSRELGQVEEAPQELEQALGLFRELGDWQSEAGALSVLANSYQERGRQTPAGAARTADVTTRVRRGDTRSKRWDAADDRARARAAELARVAARVSRQPASGGRSSLRVAGATQGTQLPFTAPHAQDRPPTVDGRRNCGSIERILWRQWDMAVPPPEVIGAVDRLAELPERIKERLANGLDATFIGPGGVPELDNMTGLRGVPLPAGRATWDACAGAYGERKIVVGSRPSPTPDVMCHEVGHALDDLDSPAGKWQSDSAEFRMLYDQCQPHLASDFHRQPGGLGRKEFFADAFAAIASRQRPALVDMLSGDTRTALRVMLYFNRGYGI